MAAEGHASGSLLNSSNLNQSTGKKQPVDASHPLSTNGVLQGVGHKAPAYQWLGKFPEKSSVAILISKAGCEMLQEIEKSVLTQCTTACL